jgi:hypothetical protein
MVLTLNRKEKPRRESEIDFTLTYRCMLLTLRDKKNYLLTLTLIKIRLGFDNLKADPIGQVKSYLQSRNC